MEESVLIWLAGVAAVAGAAVGALAAGAAAVAVPAVAAGFSGAAAGVALADVAGVSGALVVVVAVVSVGAGDRVVTWVVLALLSAVGLGGAVSTGFVGLLVPMASDDRKRGAPASCDD